MRPSIASVIGKASIERWGQALITPTVYGVVELYDSEGKAQEKGLGLLTELTRQSTENVQTVETLESIALGLVEKYVFTILLFVPSYPLASFVLVGEGAVYIKRKGKIACLLASSGKVSGNIEPGDTFLLINKSFASVFAENELARVFDELPVQDIGEKLTILLHQKPVSDGAAGLVYKAESARREEELEEKEGKEESLLERQKRVGKHWFIPQKRDGQQNTPLSLRLFQKARLYLRSLRNMIRNPKKVTVGIAILFLFLFGISVLLGIRKQHTDTKKQTVREKLEQAQYAYDEGLALLDLSPVKGRERLKEAQNILMSVQYVLSKRSQEGYRVEALMSQLEETLKVAMQVTRGSPELFFDASLVKSGAIISDIAQSGDNIAILDKNKGTVYILSLKSKKAEVVAGGSEFEDASIIGIHGDMVYVYTSNGIHSIDVQSKEVKKKVISPSSDWGSIQKINAFGGNIYLLDASKNRIWKYMGAEGGFSALREYLNPDTLPDFTEATSMSIDGSIWVATQRGSIMLFSQGQEKTFVPQGVEPAFGQNLILYTSDILNNLYVYDAANRRVVSLDKQGIYTAQYVWDSDFEAQGLVVSEEEKKIILLSGGKLYAINLK